MRGGVIPFRGTGADALRYVEADRSRADDYYLSAETTVAQFAALDSSGAVTAELSLDPEAYAGWVDWANPLTGEQMGKPRRAGSDRRGSPRFMEMVINTPKSLSIAAALHPEVSDALDAAQQDAIFTKAGADVIRRGADVAQVVNARAGMSTAQVATRGPGDRWTASGRLTRSSTFGQGIYTTTEGMTTRGAAYGARGGKKVRLMPESILEIAEDDAEVLRLLKAHGYLT